MYNLSLHIEYLLLRHDCIVMPGIGAFINVRHSAFFDTASGTWYPMSREVRFNSALTHDDGLLANSYARKNRVSFEEGREMLRRDLEQLKNALSYDGEITMGNLGIIRLHDGALSFIPQIQRDRISSLMGYLPIHSTIEKPKEKFEKEEVEISKENPSKKTNDEFNSSEDSRFDTSKNYYIAINKTFAKIAASFLVIAVIALSIILPVSNRDTVDKASVVPVDRIIKTEVIQNPVSEPQPTETSVSDNEKIDTETVHAVIATFNKREEAEKYLEYNSDCGYELEILPMKSQSRVVALSASSKEELSEKMHEGDFYDKFPKAWIWEE